MSSAADTRRVLFVLSSLRCIDGIASHLAMLVPALKERGWKVFFVAGAVDCPPAAAHVLAAIQGGSEEFVVDEPFSNEVKTTPYRLARHVWRSRMWAKKFDAKVIHLQNRSLGPPTFAARAMGGPPRVYTKQLADPPHESKPRNALSSTYGKLWGERVIAISGAMATDLMDSDRVDPDDIRYVTHGTDTRLFRRPTADERAAARAKFGIGPDTFVTTQLARVANIKRPETLAAACSKLREEGCDVLALFAGFCEPAEADKLYAAANGRHDVFKILGQQNARDVLWAADVKTLCSEREGFPSAIVEAMGCGVVPVRTRVEGAADQITEGVNGFLFDVGDEATLADVLRTLYHDRGRLADMSDVAELTAKERFDSGIMAEKTISIYEELIRHAARDPRTVVPSAAAMPVAVAAADRMTAGSSH